MLVFRVGKCLLVQTTNVLNLRAKKKCGRKVVVYKTRDVSSFFLFCCWSFSFERESFLLDPKKGGKKQQSSLRLFFCLFFILFEEKTQKKREEEEEARELLRDESSKRRKKAN